MRLLSRVLLLSFLVSVVSALPARAEEFYIELGRTTNEAEAEQNWIALRDAHPKILGRYRFFPNPIVDPDGNVTYRVQAGPMASKLDAQRVCNRLFRKQLACFVIEGFDPNKANSFAANHERPPARFGLQDFLPWRTTQDVAPPAPVQGQEQVKEAPVATEPKQEKETLPPRRAETPKEPEPSNKAKVDVAEAIAVPVSQDEGNEVTVPEAPAVFSFDNIFSSSDAESKKDGATPAASATPGWLSVQPFLNEESATAFWKNLKKRASEETRNIQMQIIHPTVSHDIPKVILSMGSFDSEEAAMRVCKKYISGSQYLECMFSSVPPEGEVSATPGKNDARQSSHATAADEYSLFWVDVLEEKEQERLLERWERIRTDNDDLLADIRSQITTSFSNPGMYMVRIGPLKMKSKAQKLCDALNARKISCNVTAL